MPSVLVLCEYATLNGGERSMLSTFETITATGWQVRVAAPAASRPTNCDAKALISCHSNRGTPPAHGFL